MYDKDKIFNSEAIRDTAVHISDTSDCKGFAKKTVVVHNNLDQDVVCKLQGSVKKNFNHPIKMEPNFTVPMNDEKYITSDDYMPFIRVKADCSIAPTTGDLDCWVLKVS